MSDIISSARGSRWSVAASSLALLLLALILFFWPTVESLFAVWAHSETFNHCFFIPPIVLWLVWGKRRELLQVAPRISYWGILAMAAASGLWLLGAVASVQMVQHLAFVLMIEAAVLTVWGVTAFRVILFPILYLLFAAPLGDFLTGYLQDFTADFVVRFLQILNIPVYSDGVFISIPTGNFEVAEACSGVRFLIATLAVGTLFAYLSYKSMKRRLVFCAIAIVVPIIANGFRALLTVLIAYATNNRLAAGVDHIIYGWGFFAFILLVLLFIGAKFADKPLAPPSLSPRPDTSHSSTPITLATAAVAAFLLAAAAPAYAHVIEIRAEAVDVTPLFPASAGAWQATDGTELPSWQPVFAGADREATKSYRNAAGKVITLYSALYFGQKQGKELSNNGNSVVGHKPWQRAGSGTKVLPGIGRAAYIRMTTLRETGTIYLWYRVDGTLTTSPAVAKLLYAKAAILGGDLSAGIIAVALPQQLDDKETQALAADFLKALGPLPALFRTNGKG
jgi:exosortase A